MSAYYNEIDPYAAALLREAIAAGAIAPGEVDTRSIKEVQADDLKNFTQCHFFAGLGGWSHALRLAGWPDHRPVWTGSCPCQPFSLAGKKEGFEDPRHLWPDFRRLITDASPPIIFGEQVASASKWLALVRSDLDALGYAVGAIPIEAASAGADHLRDRYWFVGDATGDGWGEGWPEHEVRGGRPTAARDGLPVHLVDAIGQRGCGGDGQRQDAADAHASGEGSATDWWLGSDGKARPVKPGLRLLVDGLPGRVDAIRVFGNAIDPRPAAEFIKAFIVTKAACAA